MTHATILLVILVAISAWKCGSGEKRPESVSGTAGALIIAYRHDSADTFVAHRPDSVLALDWLREIASALDITLRVKSYPFGSLVEQIGPRQNGEGGYWLYKVNGRMIPRSSDAYRVAWSDTVTFFFDER